MTILNRVILYCKKGFEKECAAEIIEKAAALSVFGFAKVNANSAYVEFECYNNDAEKLIQSLDFSSLIFARQMFATSSLLDNLTPEDRVTPIKEIIKKINKQFGDIRVEVADTNAGKELATFCRKFTVPLRGALRQDKLLSITANIKKPVLHVFFIKNNQCFVGYSFNQNNSPFYMGIPRLKFPADAPSRSTLKLEEAFHAFIPYEEWDERLRGGLNAVDLGACPGGWTYQLVKLSMMVYAIDNGLMAESLMESGQVKHYQEDGFKFKPKKNNIYWLVCDMVEKPEKVTKLIISWLTNGWCREAIFNLKLPMKKRYEVISKCLDMIKQELTEAHVNYQIKAKHLYHDREEITVHVQRIWG